jgi:hypothetical protein
LKKAIAWEIGEDARPVRLSAGQIDLERHLEDWIEHDVGIAADDVLLIGRQVVTSFGTQLDLLGIDAEGNLVIIELKRGRTLRETVAQALEYAAWASKLTYEEVVTLATNRFGSGDAFRQAFMDQLGMSLPDTLNSGQRILLVAPEIADSTAAVIEYLSDTYQVPINAVSFDLFTIENRQILVHQFVVNEAATPMPASRKQQPSRTREDFVRLAYQNGVGEAFEHLLTLEELIPDTKFFVQGMRFGARTPDNKPLTALSAFPTAETRRHALTIYVTPANLACLYARPLADCEDLVQQLQGVGSTVGSWGGWPGVALTTLGQTEEVVRLFRKFVERATPHMEPGHL